MIDLNEDYKSEVLKIFSEKQDVILEGNKHNH